MPTVLFPTYGKNLGAPFRFESSSRPMISFVPAQSLSAHLSIGRGGGLRLPSLNFPLRL